ncbi:hypothetical protein [Dokdonia sp.]|uniref:hypothetical protein n=1 Tax=Dokdonia sp. TaxID=2024995 RepID=UPI0032630BA2
MAVSINTIKDWFRNGLRPTQTQFWATWDSFWHKDEKLPIESIEGLQDTLDTIQENNTTDAYTGSFIDQSGKEFSVVNGLITLVNSIYDDFKNGLTHHYTFNEISNSTFVDEIGPVNGIVQGNIDVSVDGIVGKGAIFNGVNASVQSLGNLGLTAFPFAFKIWFYCNNLTEVRVVIHGTDLTEHVGVSILQVSDKLLVRKGSGGTGDTARKDFITDEACLSIGWNFLFINIKEEDNYDIYVGSNLFTNSFYAGNAISVDLQGANYQLMKYSNSYYDGACDEFSVYNIEVSPAVIKAIYEKEVMGESILFETSTPLINFIFNKSINIGQPSFDVADTTNHILVGSSRRIIKVNKTTEVFSTHLLSFEAGVRGVVSSESDDVVFLLLIPAASPQLSRIQVRSLSNLDIVHQDITDTVFGVSGWYDTTSKRLYVGIVNAVRIYSFDNTTNKLTVVDTLDVPSFTTSDIHIVGNKMFLSTSGGCKLYTITAGTPYTYTFVQDIALNANEIRGVYYSETQGLFFTHGTETNAISRHDPVTYTYIEDIIIQNANQPCGFYVKDNKLWFSNAGSNNIIQAQFIS